MSSAFQLMTRPLDLFTHVDFCYFKGIIEFIDLFPVHQLIQMADEVIGRFSRQAVEKVTSDTEADGIGYGFFRIELQDVFPQPVNGRLRLWGGWPLSFRFPPRLC